MRAAARARLETLSTLTSWLNVAGKAPRQVPKRTPPHSEGAGSRNPYATAAWPPAQNTSLHLSANVHVFAASKRPLNTSLAPMPHAATRHVNCQARSEKSPAARGFLQICPGFRFPLGLPISSPSVCANSRPWPCVHQLPQAPRGSNQRPGAPLSVFLRLMKGPSH